MKIELRLNDQAKKKSLAQMFKNSALKNAAEHYQKCIQRYCDCQITGSTSERNPHEVLWICHLGDKHPPLSSEKLAEKMKKIREGGSSHWTILIGGANGFTEENIREIKPHFEWCFGPLTLPHELAAVVALEQIYRGWTILNRHPYHLGHFNR